MISPQKQIWHCFGCGAGGDVFGFVVDFEHINKFEAAKKLAKRVNVEIPDFKKDSPQISKEERKKQETRFEKGLRLLDWTAEVYHKVLNKILLDRDNPITQYCLNRGLTQEIIEKFKIGYAPKNAFLLNLVKKYGVNDQMMFDIGVFKEVSDSVFKDKFVDRLMIPVSDKQGRTVGFTGRVLPYDTSERPKYLNSPQTEWFNKSELWFGFHLSRKEIMQSKKAMVVEGNMDVISSFSKGLEFTLAAQGTSFTEKQIRLLKQTTQKVWLAFDNDNAGKIAGTKFFKEATKAGLSVYKVLIPKEFKDLDEYIQSEDFEDNLEVKPFLDYLLEEEKYDLTSHDLEKQKQAVIDVIDVMSVLDQLSLEQYLHRLNQVTGISLNTLQILVREAKKNQISYTKKEIASLEFKADAKQKEQGRSLLLSLQKLAAFYINFDKDKLPEEGVLSGLFVLLKDMVVELQDYENMGDYIRENKNNLDLIWEEGVAEKDENNLKSLLSSLVQFVDQNATDKFLIDKEKAEIYLKVKSLIK